MDKIKLENILLRFKLGIKNLNESKKEICNLSAVSHRSEMYFEFMEEYNALMGDGEYQILKEEVVVLLAKY
mgnify:FL=1